MDNLGKIMMPEAIENLIEEMTEVKAAHASLSIPDVLRIFNIQALRDLTAEIRRVANGRR